MMPSVDVIGVGDADVDVFAEVDHVPGRDEKVRAKRVEYHAGGVVANFVCALSRLGTRCAFHGPVGEDEFGRMAIADLRANGVDTHGVVVKPGGKTYYCIIMLDESGEKALLGIPTDSLYLQPEEVSEVQIARARHMHTKGASPSAPRAARVAKEHGLTVSVDLELPIGAHSSDVRPWLPCVDVLFINQQTVKVLGAGRSAEEVARDLLSSGPRMVCVTLGEAGSLVVSEGGAVRAEAFAVPVVDTTGAGDCYAAAFVHGFLQGWPLDRVATFASAAGAIIVTHWGGHTGAPTYGEVIAFLSARGVSWPQDA
jgi:sugar/nucleoside kinase (ribokinase family)